MLCISRHAFVFSILFTTLAWSGPIDPVAPSKPEGLPVQPLKSVDQIARFDAPALDRTAIAAEDVQRELDGKPPRFAIPNATTITTETHGTWELLGDTWIWRLRVSSPGATSINLGFTRYHMPPNGRLTIRAADPNANASLPSFTERDNEAHGELWTPPVRSDDVVIEVAVPKPFRSQLQLVLGSVNLGYREFGASDQQPLLSGSCNVDVVCPEGDDWRDQIRSVGVISTGGSTFCTGFMVNNTAQDLTPYFMTAAHCSINSGNAASLVVFWNYENSTCRPVGSPQSGGAGDGQLNQFQTGSFFRAASSPSDFTLVELDDDPNPEWEVVFAGWSRSTGESPSGACIHHPNTDEKRITFYDTPTTTTSYNNPSVPGDGTHVHAVWSLGVTEPGSSGSPLFDVNHRVIGQLHGGPSACGASDRSDYYGRFSRSWTGGGSSSTRLSNWLDPINSGVIAIDHVSSGGLNVTPAENVLHMGVVGGPFTNPTVIYTLSNPKNLPLDYSVSLTNSFGVLLDGAAADLTGTLAANGGTAQVEVSLGPAIDALAAGNYVESIVFEDLTNGLVHTRVHTVEIGQTSISVSPSNGLESGGPIGGPFPGSIVYTITSERPTPVTVEVSASDNWISLNGSPGPLTLNLSGTGDSETVTVAFSAAADALSPGIYSGSVGFTNESGGQGDTSRPISLDVGRIVYPSSDTPKPISDNSTVNSIINVAEDFCIGDVEVELDISHTYIGDLIVELTSPGGTVVRLHNRTGGTTENIVATYDDDGGGLIPDGPGTLSDFDAERSVGAWTLTVSDNAGSDTGTLNSWSLRIAPVGGNCPTPEQIYSFPLDTNPGWTVQGGWAFGDPTGGGSGNGDPNTGFTGANVYGFNLSGDYPSNMGATQYLTTTAIDCTNITNTKLRFMRWLGIESSSYDHANIQVSSNGTTWTTIWNHSGATFDEGAWSAQSFDISSVADGQPAIQIRWGMGTTDGSVTFGGWNLDDVEIWGVVASAADCNGNQIPDDEDITGGFSQDCNGNDVPDECDISEGGSRDCNADQTPDECGYPSIGLPPSPRVRFISVDPTGASGSTALRVKLVSLHHPVPPYAAGLVADFSAWEGQARWIGPPVTYVESTSNPIPFKAASLQCEPYYADWSTVGLLHITGSAIVPSSQYAVQFILEDCDTEDENNYSNTITRSTGRWGDVEDPFNPPSPTVQPDVADIGALVNKFRSAPGSLIKARAFIASPSDTGEINLALDLDFSHISACVDAFRGLPYPYTIADCP